MFLDGIRALAALQLVTLQRHSGQPTYHSALLPLSSGGSASLRAHLVWPGQTLDYFLSHFSNLLAD